MYNPHNHYGFHSIYPSIDSTRTSRQQKGRQANVNTPFWPILGEQSNEQLVERVQKAIMDEAAASEFYARLLREAPNELHKEFIEHAYEDELKHQDAFTKLYVYINGAEPQYMMKAVEYSDYKEGILKALKDELEAAEFYRNILLMSSDPLVRDTFFYALIDELEHANHFGVLYNTL